MKPKRRATAGIAGVLATALLHFLFLAAAVWGGGARAIARLPDAVGAGANSGKPDGASDERMIVIRLSSDVPAEQRSLLESPQLAAPLIKPSMVEITGPDVAPPPPLVFEREGEATEASEADIIARTKLAGMYESQIRARIERAWSAPMAERTSSLYSCRVKIRQRRDGQIEDVKLEHCEGSFAWLDSLVVAVYSASPLPGPPHPSVFVESFSLQFKAQVIP